MDFNNEIAQSNNNQVSASADANTAKAVQEVQASLIIAQRFPRNLSQVNVDILSMCEINSLAEEAQYTYPRGKTRVTGPSIRLAEVLAQNYGNMTFGFRILSQNSDSSEVESFAWDLQKNVKTTRTFSVAHYRDTRQGRKKLTEERDIYEMVANQAQRRVRACILGIVPKNFQEDAVAQCNKTLMGGDVPLSERVKKLSMAFKDIGVSIEMIEGHLKHNLDAMIESELVELRGIYKSIKDGMSKREEWFELSATRSNETLAIEDAVANTVSKIKDKQTEKTKEKK
jgi:hypothetical protein